MNKCKEPIKYHKKHKIEPQPSTSRHHRVLSGLTNHLDDQILSILNARAQLRLALLHVGTDEEQPAVSDLRQGQGVVQVGDAAGTWKILKTGFNFKTWRKKL